MTDELDDDDDNTLLDDVTASGEPLTGGKEEPARDSNSEDEQALDLSDFIAPNADTSRFENEIEQYNAVRLHDEIFQRSDAKTIKWRNYVWDLLNAARLTERSRHHCIAGDILRSELLALLNVRLSGYAVMALDWESAKAMLPDHDSLRGDPPEGVDVVLGFLPDRWHEPRQLPAELHECEGRVLRVDFSHLNLMPLHSAHVIARSKGEQGILVSMGYTLVKDCLPHTSQPSKRQKVTDKVMSLFSSSSHSSSSSFIPSSSSYHSSGSSSPSYKHAVSTTFHGSLHAAAIRHGRPLSSFDLFLSAALAEDAECRLQSAR